LIRVTHSTTSINLKYTWTKISTAAKLNIFHPSATSYGAQCHVCKSNFDL